MNQFQLNPLAVQRYIERTRFYEDERFLFVRE